MANLAISQFDIPPRNPCIHTTLGLLSKTSVAVSTYNSKIALQTKGIIESLISSVNSVHYESLSIESPGLSLPKFHLSI